MLICAQNFMRWVKVLTLNFFREIEVLIYIRNMAKFGDKLLSSKRREIEVLYFSTDSTEASKRQIL